MQMVSASLLFHVWSRVSLLCFRNAGTACPAIIIFEAEEEYPILMNVLMV